jgi:K(+)-stimulated pyrophosphate-energized sodium pump
MKVLKRICERTVSSAFAVVAVTFLLSLHAAPAAAQEPTAGGASTGMHVVWWLVAFVGSLVALVFAFHFYRQMLASDEGDAEMVRVAGYVREGANAYLYQQYKIVAIFFAVVCALLVVVAFVLKAQSGWVPFAFLTGGFFSGLAGWFGMKTATWASSRTAAGAKKSLNAGLQVAFRSGAVMGLTVVGLGLLDITLWFLVLNWLVPAISGHHMTLEEITVTMLCFGMGASSQALFARVGGGIFTKAADVGADLVGKVEAGIPEDDPRNPATIADNVGDNVGDVAGMGADLYESYCGSILASAALGVAALASQGESAQIQALLLPMALAGVGTLLSVMGIFFVRTEEGASQRNLLNALARGIDLSSALVIVAALVLCYLLLHGVQINGLTIWWRLAASVVVGLGAGWLIGKWTEYSTSDEYNPTRRIADQAVTGPATVIIAGVAEGMYSVWVPIVVICAGILLAFGFPAGFDFNSPDTFALGLYGVGIAAVGMLSTLGITLATDAYGPIADNAGGNAQMTNQEPIVRERTDALDSLGNTTAATGKGFAIGSAALTALALLAAYVEEVRVGFDRWAAAVEVNPGTPWSLHQVTNDFLVWSKPTTDGVEHQAVLVLDQDDAAEILKQPNPTLSEADLPTLHNRGLVLASEASIPDYVRYYHVTLMNPKVLVGLFLGVMVAYVFSSLTMKAVGRSAGSMVQEVRRQFREDPGIMDGTTTPDYAACVAISTKAAQREMILPAVLGLGAPVVGGVILGVGGVMGMLAGALTGGFAIAIMMANAGGAWDNAKKFIEAGAHGGKGSDAHKAGVVGDTVGDPFKDTSGPSLNILIKLMSMVSVVASGFVVRFSLQAMGIF